MALPPLPTGRRIGFWVADDDIFSGDQVFGNAKGTVPTPQQFFNAYFGTPPYPATMVWTGGLQSSAGLSVPPAQEAQWFDQLLKICDGYPNIKIWMIAFINLTGFSIEGAQFAPPQPNPLGITNVGFSLKRASPLTQFNIATTAGLAPSTNYTLQLLDVNFNLIANITTFTTDSTGAATVVAGLPNTTSAQANAGGYVVVQGTHVGIGCGWTQDQTQDFTNYMQAIQGHPSFVGVLFEPEYFGNNAQIQATFKSIVNGVNYYELGGINSPSTGDAVMVYSTYPFFSGALVTGAAGAGVLGVHYGETGSPPNIVSSTTKSGTTPTVLVDTSLNLVPNSLVGALLQYNSGPAKGQSRVITANTATTITTAPFSTAPTPGGGDNYDVATAIWTQAVVTNIVENSIAAPVNIIIAFNDTNNPAGTAAPAFQTADGTDWYLYMSPVLRGWIMNDPTYQNSFLQSGGQGPPSLRATTLTLIAKAV